MAEHGFYRSSGASWQRALPPELCRPDDGEVLRRGWDLLALDREGARRLTARGGLRCRTLLLPQGAWTEPLAVRQAVSYGPSPQSTLTLSQSDAAGRAVCAAAGDGAGRLRHRAPGYPAAGGVGVLGDRAAAAVGGGIPAAGAAVKREKERPAEGGSFFLEKSFRKESRARSEASGGVRGGGGGVLLTVHLQQTGSGRRSR